jgi:fructose-1,6-bisphosphatase II
VPDGGVPSTIPSTSPWFAYALRQASEAAARAAFAWIGRGRKNDGDGAAVHAMRHALGQLGIDGVVVIGEGAKDGAPELYRGERVGDPAREPQFDIAVDPVEGTTYLAKGLTNAMAVIALAPRGAMLDPGPCFYMEKLAAPPAARARLDPEAPTAERLRQLAAALDKPIGQLTVYVLEKPRHNALVAAIHEVGARVAVYPAGDIAGAVMAAIPGSGIDALMGTGGTPEGILAACAVRALGGVLYGRLDPQLQTETIEVRRAGLDTTRWYEVEELVTSEDTFFCATGITSGLLIEGVERGPMYDRLQTLMIVGRTGERQVLTSYYPHARAAQALAEENRCLSIA